MARIAVLGASGKTGAAVVERALDAGHEVVGMVRSPDSFAAPAGLEVVQGDVMDPDGLAQLKEHLGAMAADLVTERQNSWEGQLLTSFLRLSSEPEGVMVR